MLIPTSLPVTSCQPSAISYCRFRREDSASLQRQSGSRPFNFLILANLSARGAG